MFETLVKVLSISGILIYLGSLIITPLIPKVVKKWEVRKMKKLLKKKQMTEKEI